MKRLLALAALAASVLTGTSYGARAADIRVTKMDTTTVITVIGTIELMDGVKFKKLTSRIKDDNAIVTLSSPGGNVLGGLGIARTIHNNGWMTIVGDDTLCASACADIWLAGSTRLVAPTAKIGMHSAGREVAVKVKGKKTKKMVRGDEGNLLRIKYFVDIGLGKDAIVAMLTPDPDSMMWLTPSTAETLGIEFSATKG